MSTECELCHRSDIELGFYYDQYLCDGCYAECNGVATCVDCQDPLTADEPGPACTECNQFALSILRKGTPVGLCS